MKAFIFKHKLLVFFSFSLMISILIKLIFKLPIIQFIYTSIIVTAVMILIIASPFVSKKLSKFLQDYADKNLKENKRFNHYSNLAITSYGLKPFRVGKKKQHIVYAISQQRANKFYNDRIKSLEKKHPKKEYYYVFPHCNNLNDGKK